MFITLILAIEICIGERLIEISAVGCQHHKTRVNTEDRIELRSN